MDKIKLFCLPYAGGSAVVFKKWIQYLDKDIELIPIELSGRGKRIGEPLYQDVMAATEDVFQQIKNEINYSSYCFYGHSLGAMISYELAQKIRKQNIRQPVHIFFSGRRAPHVDLEEEKKYHLMDNNEFRDELLDLGGTPKELFEHPELLELFLPILKNDFRIAETYVKSDHIDPLESDITVMLGKQDDLTLVKSEEWKLHARNDCDIHYFEGDHFFINDQPENVVDIINNKLTEKTLKKAIEC